MQANYRLLHSPIRFSRAVSSRPNQRYPRTRAGNLRISKFPQDERGGSISHRAQRSPARQHRPQRSIPQQVLSPSRYLERYVLIDPVKLLPADSTHMHQLLDARERMIGAVGNNFTRKGMTNAGKPFELFGCRPVNGNAMGNQ